MENKLDGNAIGGLLQEIFPFEMTSVQATCAGCGATGAIGALAVYMHGMGAVVRCPFCDLVLIRVARPARSYFLDMQGVRVLQITPEAPEQPG